MTSIFSVETTKAVWILYKNRWIDANLLELNDDNAVVQLDNNEKYVVSKDNIKPKPHENLLYIEDLIKLSHLHEPSILDTLVKRYTVNKIYTNTGPVLIAINPYHTLDIYNDSYLEKYSTLREGCNTMTLSEDSHIYLVAASALKDLSAGVLQNFLLALEPSISAARWQCLYQPQEHSC